MVKNKRFVVLARNPRTMREGITTGKGHRSFRKRSGLVISDPAEAREIEQKYGKQVGVVEDDRLGWHYDHDLQTNGMRSDIHHYTFQGVDMSRIKTTRDNGYVWAWVDGKQRRMLRSVAIEEGYEIVEKNHAS